MPKLSAASANVIDQIAAANGETRDACLARLLALPSYGTQGTRLVKGELTSLYVTGSPVPALDVSTLRHLEGLSLEETSTHRLTLPANGTLVDLSVTCRKSGVRTVDAISKQRSLRSLILHCNDASIDITAQRGLATLWIRGPVDLKLGMYPALTYFALEKVVTTPVLDLRRSTKLALLALTSCRALRTIRIGSPLLTRVAVRGCAALREVEAPSAALAASAVLRKLAGGSPDDDAFRLHERLRKYNWDNGTGGVLAIVRNAKCALPTAQLAYWMARPSFYQAFTEKAEVPDHARDGWTLLEEIEQRVETGGYRPLSVPWTAGERQLAKQRPTRKWNVPKALFPLLKR